MKLRNKVGISLLLFFSISLSVIAGLIAYTADCAPADSLAANVDRFKAITYRCYGPPSVLEFVDIEKPAPENDEVLVKVHAASVNPLDWHYMRGSPYVMRAMVGIGTPDNMRMGRDYAGTVEAIGKNVTKFKVGDAVFGGADGAFGEYVVIRDSRAIVHIPDNVSFEQAAAIPVAAITALQAIRDIGQLKAGQKVLINGASGGVGTYAVQIAKAMGAEVHGVCSTRNLELVRGLGADKVFDYKKEDYTESEHRYDLIIDNVANHSPLANTQVLNADGILVTVGGAKGDWVGPFISPLMAMITQPFVSQDLEGIMAQLKQEDLVDLADLMHAGKMKSVIDRRYSLSETAKAVAYSESGRARGKIIITVL
jgi:NADPH:quinone reductase-like Zn-dependent oxidoreductase